MLRKLINMIKSCNWNKPSIISFGSEVSKKLNYNINNLKDIIKDLGGKIFQVDYEEAVNTPSLVVENSNNFSIYINPLIQNINQLLAHELGHYILHSNIGKFPLRIPRDSSGRAEWEADWFAAGFLVPDHLLKPKMKKAKFGRAELAEYFKVSEIIINRKLEVN